MAKIEFKGIDAYSKKLIRLSADLETRVLGPAIYDGADTVMKAVLEELRAVPTDDRRFVPKGEMRGGPMSDQKEALIRSYGIAPMQVDEKGFLNVKIGVDDYNHIVSRKWPKGQPNLMIARAINSGTSFMVSHPYVKAAVRKIRKAAEAIMEKRVNEEINKTMK